MLNLNIAISVACKKVAPLAYEDATFPQYLWKAATWYMYIVSIVIRYSMSPNKFFKQYISLFRKQNTIYFEVFKIQEQISVTLSHPGEYKSRIWGQICLIWGMYLLPVHVDRTTSGELKINIMNGAATDSLKFSEIKGTVQRDFNYVFWHILIGLGLNTNRFYF